MLGLSEPVAGAEQNGEKRENSPRERVPQS